MAQSLVENTSIKWARLMNVVKVSLNICYIRIFLLKIK